MNQVSQLSEREKEVVRLLLQGKSNKLIALSLGISDRTVEFHLSNIYVKLQVRSRIELILNLGNTTDITFTEKLWCSTVDTVEEYPENRDKRNLRMNGAAFFRKAVLIKGTNSKVKNLLNPKHILAAATTVLFSGFIWGAVLAIFVGKTTP